MKIINTTRVQEMYLIYINRIAKEKGNVRLIDLVELTGFSKSTVHDAIDRLADKELVLKHDNDIILTSEGLHIVESVELKHKSIYELLKIVGANHEIAEEHACEIEHVITDEMLVILDNFLAANKKDSVLI